MAKSPDGCRAGLRLTARDGERATVHVTVPALPAIPFYAFASPAGRAVYITVDDGWTPSSQVLVTMQRTHLPVTAFLIEQAAQRNLVYWRAFAEAGGTIGDHTVSHPDLTKLSLSQATLQWAQARAALGRWFGKTPAMGRPPYGAWDPTVAAAAYRAGLKDLVGWSATVTSTGVPHLERQGTGARRDRAPALGPRPGPANDQAPGGHPRTAPASDAADSRQLRRHRPPAALAGW